MLAYRHGHAYVIIKNLFSSSGAYEEYLMVKIEILCVPCLPRSPLLVPTSVALYDIGW
jgi:hypothetical protein